MSRRARPRSRRPELPATLPLFAPTAPGLEDICADELSTLGVTRISPGPGGVSFQGSLAAVYRANLGLRTADRVLVRLRDFRVKSWDSLVRQAALLGPEVAQHHHVVLEADRQPVERQRAARHLKVNIAAQSPFDGWGADHFLLVNDGDGSYPAYIEVEQVQLGLLGANALDHLRADYIVLSYQVTWRICHDNPLGGGQLLIIDQRNTTAVWDERGGQWQSLELGENARVDAAIPLRDDKILLSLFSGRLVIVGPDLSWHEIPVPATPDGAYPRHDIVRLDDGRLLVARWPQGTQLWSADGTHLLSWSEDGTARVWAIDGG